MENMSKNSQLKDVTNLLKKKTKRPIIVQEIDSENDIEPKQPEFELENINLNFEKYCYLCHKEINIFYENHSFFQCMTCSKYFHKECYKEYKLKQTEKDICKNVIRINKINYEINSQNSNNSSNNKFFGKECILCIMQNNSYCIICKKKIETDNELVIQCELCGNLMHYKCLDIPLYFIFYRELYKNIFINNNIPIEKYKEFLLKIKEINNKEINKDLLPKLYDKLNIKQNSFILNFLFYVCTFCKTRNLYDLQEINVFKSTSFSKVNFYNTTLNPISQNINKVKISWNLNKIHEIYISSSNPYNDALFDSEKYDSDYVVPQPIKIVKKYEHNRINNVIIKNTSMINNNNKNITEEEEIYELSNIVQMFEDGELKNKDNKNEIKENKNNINNISNENNNKNINDNNNNIDTNSKMDKSKSEKMDIISENIELNEMEKSESDTDKNISIEDKCFYLIKWNTLEYSLELDSLMHTFNNFNQILSDYNKEEMSQEKINNYPNEKIFQDDIEQILNKLGLNKNKDFANLKNNIFIYKTKEEIIKYKNNILSIINELMKMKQEKNKYYPHILILDDNSKNSNNNNSNNSLFKLIEKSSTNFLNLSSNKQTFIYECINFSKDLYSFIGDELNVLKINNNIYLNKNKENILEEENIKRYTNPYILIDNIDSKNLSFLQDYHFDLIIFDLNNNKSLLKIREFFKKITSPLNTNFATLKYILLEQNETMKNSGEKNNLDAFKCLDKIINNFFKLFYNKEDTILLYGNYSGINLNTKNLKINSDEKDNLKQINLVQNSVREIPEDEDDIDPFFYQKNFINLNFATLQYNECFNGFIINNMKWSLNLDKRKYHYIQLLSSLVLKYDTKIFSLRSKEYNEIIMNFIPINLDKETFTQYLYIIKNKPEVLLKTQENKKDLMQNILLLCSLPSCMTKFYKKYLEDYKLSIKDNINISKIDVFYQLSRILLKKTKGKIIIIFPLHDKVYRENDSLLRKIRNEIHKIFFSNINPENKEINIEQRKKNFFCFLMDEDGLFEEIKNSENAKYPTHIIIFNMFLQNKNTGEFFNFITKNKFKHKIILYQFYISNLIEGKLSQVFYSKLNQFIEICSSPLRKMKTTVYGQLTLSDKEIITITDLKKTFEKEMAKNFSDEIDLFDKRNDINNLNIVTSYKNLKNDIKNFDGFIYVQKNTYLICTNSQNINLRYDHIYNTFVGNISFNNYENNSMNNKNDAEENDTQKTKNWLEIYNNNLIKYKKKKFYQELDFLKDESNFENLKTNKLDLTSSSPTNNNNNTNNNNINTNNTDNNNLNMNFTINHNGVDSHMNLNNQRREEVYILNDSNENFRGNRNDEGNNGQKKKRGRKRKNFGNELNNLNINNSNINSNINDINNNSNNNQNNNGGEPIQIPNDDENDEINSIISDVNNNNLNNHNIINNPIANSLNMNNINTNVNNNNENQNEENRNDNIPVNLDEITEDYSDTYSENSQERNLRDGNGVNGNERKEEKEKESKMLDVEDNNNKKEISNNNEKNISNNNNEINNKDLNFQEMNNNEKTYDLIKNIANSILSNDNINNVSEYQEQLSPNENQQKNESDAPSQDIEQIEKLINETKLESSRDKLYKIYNFLLLNGFEEKTRKLFAKCLLNYGFPLTNEFDKFYVLFQMNAQHLKMKNIPNKIISKLYYELVFFVLEEDESLDYNLFVFGEERTSLIRTKLLIIRQFQSFKDVTKAMYYFVKDRYNNIFGNVEPKLEESYQRVHFVMAKLLSNIVNKCIKSGFLNYKNYIKDDNIIFDNIRIKKDGQTSNTFNIREGIAKKIFGKTMNENEFNNAIISYYEALFVQIMKVPDNILNNSENVIR